MLDGPKGRELLLESVAPSTDVAEPPTELSARQFSQSPQPFCDSAHKARIFRLDPGNYFWCQCGRSKNQPWCDGSHEGTGQEPLEFQLRKEERVALCNCKHTACAPFCDNAHREV